MGRVGANLSVSQGMAPAVPPPLHRASGRRTMGGRINRHFVGRLIFGWVKGKSCCGLSVSVMSMSGGGG